MAIELSLIVAAVLLAGMTGAAFGVGAWFGARLAARLLGREAPVFRDPPGMKIDEDDIEELQTT